MSDFISLEQLSSAEVIYGYTYVSFHCITEDTGIVRQRNKYLLT